MLVHIFYPSFYDPISDKINIGGVQNYLLNLSLLLKRNGFQPIIYQVAQEDFEHDLKGIRIKGFKIPQTKNSKGHIKYIFKKVKEDISDKDLIIWGSERIAIKVKSKSIAIQHGIPFDYIPFSKNNRENYNVRDKAYKIGQSYMAIRDFLVCENVVCVDYNYLNWIRTMIPRNLCNNIQVIPNFGKARLESKLNYFTNDPLKILYSRTFSAKRGIYILIDIIDKLQDLKYNIQFTIAGEGELNNLLQKKYYNNTNVKITNFDVGSSTEINLNHHINLVPSYGSEGTSFSLLEGMGCGSVPIASNVGGMTNIVIDGYNGYLVNPEATEFVNKILFLNDNRQLLQKLSHHSIETVSLGFDQAIWERKWINYINGIIHV